MLAWARGRGIALFERDGTLRGGLLAGVLFAAEFACIFIGLQFTSASRMVVFIYLSPFVVAALMPLVARGERIVALAVAGPGRRLCGCGLGLRRRLHAGRAGAAAAVARRRARHRRGPDCGARPRWRFAARALAGAVAEKTLLYQLAVSALALGAGAALAGERWPVAWGAASLGSLAFQTVIVTFASYLTWFWLVRHYPATRLAAFTLLTPVFGLAAGVLLLAEPLTLRLMVALGAVVARPGAGEPALNRQVDIS